MIHPTLTHSFFYSEIDITTSLLSEKFSPLVSSKKMILQIDFIKKYFKNISNCLTISFLSIRYLYFLEIENLQLVLNIFYVHDSQKLWNKFVNNCTEKMLIFVHIHMQLWNFVENIKTMLICINWYAII